MRTNEVDDVLSIEYKGRVFYISTTENTAKQIDAMVYAGLLSEDEGCELYDKTIDYINKPRTEDDVDHPTHYNTGNIEVIDAIEDWQLGFHLGNVVKYVARAGKKDPDRVIEDLKKAQWYLARYINSLDPS